MEIEVGQMITKNDGRIYLLMDKTIQNDKTYFLAAKLNEEQEPTTDSHIFELKEYDNEKYLVDVSDSKIIELVSAIFVNKSYKKGLEGASLN